MKPHTALLIFAVICMHASASPFIKDDELPIAQACDEEKCQLPDCRCASSDIPGGLKLEETPQFVFLTFDDAVRSDNYDLYVETLFGREKNPDNCNVTATLFVSHDYTIYAKLHDLYENGFEVALHSITHDPNTTKWSEASVEYLKKEFGGEREIITKFAKIPEEDIHGIRVPFLQLSGNNSFELIKELDLEYDCSWPTRSFVEPGLWPYTLDYKSPQDCPIGPCPTASLPGVWVAPMLDLFDNKNVPCAMVDQCVNIPTDAANVTDWIIENFNRNYNNNKAPFGFYVHATWLSTNKEHVQAYKNFVDYLQTLPDVYIVGIHRALEWIKNPVPIGSADWPACPTVKKSKCEDKLCTYKKDDGSEIIMHICADIACPNNYPTPDNPLGK
ncbi:chitin deacetylase 8 [Coccinella septempunctata]|uniref:chitin deacetylase 8 n=1 Tax=Coccinella septempunctata TaxID=41139 RepID=UPI001D068466|nr:chitin deacetylase 8 [Coccinella septempunctata]